MRAHAIVTLGMAVWMAGCGPDSSSTVGVEEPSAESLSAFARCLTDAGWVMYGSVTCSACRSQRKAFGEAIAQIVEIECNPHMPDAQAERCLERGVRRTPTWIRELDGEVIQRLEDYQLLEALAAASDCPL